MVGTLRLSSNFLARNDGKPWSRRIAEPIIGCQIQLSGKRGPSPTTVAQFQIGMRDTISKSRLFSGQDLRQCDMWNKSRNRQMWSSSEAASSAAQQHSFLARSGRNPVLIERADTIASATTSVSAHAIRCQFAEPENIAQTSESLRIYETFRDVIGDPSAQINLIQNGYLFASTDDADIPSFEKRVTLQQSLGVTDVELLDRR